MKTLKTITALITVLLLASGASAQNDASKSTEACQKGVQKETAKLSVATHKAMANCLNKIAVKVVKDNQGAVSVSDAIGTCRSQFYKIGRTDGKSLVDKMEAKVAKKCDPAANAHVTDDILGGLGASVNQPLMAAQLDGYCANFATGANTIEEWYECLKEAAVCQARQQIAVEYPRALEWLDEMEGWLGTESDPVWIQAHAALEAAMSAIEGVTDDNLPEIACGPSSGGGGGGGLLATGQTDCDPVGDGTGYPGPCPGTPANQDGELQQGTARSYSFDTSVAGARTVIDNITGLEWEVLCNEDPPGATCPTDHDMDTLYTWVGAFAKVAGMNAASYAGHTDWRLPNVNELHSLADYGQVTPAIDPTFFDTACVAPCTADACSCTPSDFHWSSTTWERGADDAWEVDFWDGGMGALYKAGSAYVRAVRGGS